MTELHEAVRSGDLALVQAILFSNPSFVNEWDQDYQTPLHVVCRVLADSDQPNDGLLIMQTLIDYGADVNARGLIDSRPPLHVVLAKYWARDVCPPIIIEMVKLLLERGADPNLHDDEGESIALHNAIFFNSIEILELLLKHGAEINAVNRVGTTALDQAIWSKTFDLARFLVDHGAKASNVHWTIFNNIMRMEKNQIKFLVEHGANINLSGRCFLKTLYFAAESRRDFLEEIMLEQGINVEELKREGDGKTELHHAAAKGDETRVQELLKAGADVNAKDVMDNTPLHHVLSCLPKIELPITCSRRRTALRVIEPEGNYPNFYGMSKLLIEAGADLHTQNLLGFTCLHMPNYRRHFNIVKLLLSTVAGVEESKQKDGSILWHSAPDIYAPKLYPLAVAIACGYEKFAHNMIKMGHHLKPTSSAVDVMPPLYYAVEKRNYGIAKMLLEAGCQTDGYYFYGTPRIDQRKQDNDILEIVCLLWEYNYKFIIKKPIVDAFLHIIAGQNGNKLTSLLVLFYKIGLRSNKLDKDFFRTKNYRTSWIRHFHSNQRLSSFLTLCDEQLDELKKVVICGSASKYDLLTMKLDELVKFLNDENNFKICKELRSSFVNSEEIESYDFALKVRLDLAMEKRRLLDSAKDLLDEIVCLPDEINDVILSYLNVRELKKMSGKDKLL